jgi:hypothetical protein
MCRRRHQQPRPTHFFGGVLETKRVFFGAEKRLKFQTKRTMLSLTDEATTQKLDAIDKVRLLLAIASTKCVFC